ncbi:oxygen-dependent coproporphyrinogen oxidase [Aureibacter tunicatorum]|uniref:coproporphyrinogen oxidase n=1 Tax=Aureibacter tunicatorum TaxID=866807 RepID=A0AAE3XN98_9BACT|nr:oxygen-dependent coproporphyrinogen oxidase [Aureibacter tunicatorum]MDR6239718.1 coproporphyrinogen III oxidase [Aureibacter tunicatorum]BDD04194.1 coproporphyrinogen oxidase [Aureibacter tunicatorum]
MDKNTIQKAFEKLQDDICNELEKADGKGVFKQDLWERENNGGGGRTRIIKDGNVIEKGGVNFSAVHGKTPEKILAALGLSESDFFATGVSIVIHPKSPMVPIIHMNVRYFEMSNGIFWFGGGIDLTPHYIDETDATFFHNSLKNVCDRHYASYYSKFKTWADDYFYIPHRQETRGIGGIFFDRLSETSEKTKTDIFNFVLDVGNQFAPIYTELMNKNKSLAFNSAHEKWQKVRRGRYVEFNLVYDKGTKFGLDTNGRTESILMSMPPEAQWEYCFDVEKGSEEEKTLNLLKKGINWLNQ